MNIKARINARKILLVYYYEQYFFLMSGENKAAITGIDKIRKIVANPGDDLEEDIDLTQVFKDGYYGDFDKEIIYIIDNYFEKFESDEIDFEYIKELWHRFEESIDPVRELVDMYATTFGYDSMDLMDRVLFILWYVEYTHLGTPKEVVLNEMVELAKRYGDESSPKLLNGIGHKIFAGLDKEK